MNLDEIKEIIEKDRGKFIIVEDGKPTMVVISFDDYKNLLKINPKEELESEVDNYRKDFGSEEEKTNFASVPLHGTKEKKEFPIIEDSEEEEEMPENPEIPPELEEEPLKIEDLPF